MSSRGRLLTALAICIFLFPAAPIAPFSEATQVSDEARAGVGFPFRIIREMDSSLGPPTRFAFIEVSEDYYSKDRLLQLWRHFCELYPDKTKKLDVRIYVKRKLGRSEVSRITSNEGQLPSERSFDVNFLRQGDGALSGGGENELLIYSPNLDKPAEVVRITIKGRDPFDPYASTGIPDQDFVAAAARRDLSKLRSLLAEGASVNSRDRYQSTALMKAATVGYDEIVEFLLKRGADINARDEAGWTALICAASHGQTQTVRRLLENGADLNSRNDLGVSALTRAIYDGKIDTVKLLLRIGADVDLKDKWGNTALILAAERAPEVLRDLLVRGVAVNVQNSMGETALMRAQKRDAVIALLEVGALINSQDAAGNTTLMHAIRDHNTDKVRTLVSHGADVTIKNNKGTTALQIARLYENQGEVIRVLLGAGAKD